MLSRSEALQDQALAKAMFPGMGHIDVLRGIHQYMRPERYLEIGVGSGYSLALSRPPTQAFGVEPNPAVRQRIKNPNTKIFVGESDAFFEQLRGLPKHITFDLIFVDGLHHFDQTVRDIYNAEKHSHAKTLICCHDIHPIHSKSASRERVNNLWSGDVWKTLPILQEHRPDLTLSYVPCFPSGLLLITGLDPESRKLQDTEADYTKAYMDRDFEKDAFDALVRSLPQVKNEIDDIRRFLRASTVTPPTES